MMKNVMTSKKELMNLEDEFLEKVGCRLRCINTKEQPDRGEVKLEITCTIINSEKYELYKEAMVCKYNIKTYEELEQEARQKNRLS